MKSRGPTYHEYAVITVLVVVQGSLVTSVLGISNEERHERRYHQPLFSLGMRTGHSHLAEMVLQYRKSDIFKGEWTEVDKVLLESWQSGREGPF